MIELLLKWTVEAFDGNSDSRECIEYAHKVLYQMVSVK